jgi:hypothetical protein
MTLEELLDKIDGLTESLSGKMSDALLFSYSGRLAETYIDLDGNAISEILEVLRHSRAIVLAELEK